MPNRRFSSKLKISLIKLEDVVDAILVVEALEITVKITSKERVLFATILQRKTPSGSATVKHNTAIIQLK